MATALYPSVDMTSYNNQCGEPDMDAFLDFSSMPSPSNATSKLPVSSTSPSNLTSPATTALPLDQSEDLQTPAKPSHEYERWKQQTGLPTNSVPGLHQQPQNNYQQVFSNSGIGFDDIGLMGSSGLEESWSSGIGMGADVNMDVDLSMPSSALPSFFFPDAASFSQSDDFIDPSAIASPEEPKANIRVWPGMHQQQAQQAALAKAQAHAHAQQRQQQILQQQQRQQQQQQQARNGHQRRVPSQAAADPRVEETIARVVNQIRRSSAMASHGDSGSPPSLPHIIRMKKDEEDMDEDERLLASEEGKKLSSKERRQLRNKVSARAFRSRRKEYIGQLEGEVALKTTECNDLRAQNRALMEENARSRVFIEKLLRHQAFKPFLEDLSREENISAKMSVPSSSLSTPTPVSARPKELDPFSPASQQSFQELSQPENPQIGMALVPEPQLDLSMLNINNAGWSMPPMTYYHQRPQVFAVMELPQGPESPLDTEALSGKGSEHFAFDSEDSYEAPEELKVDYPVMEQSSVSQSSVEKTAPVTEEAEEEDPLFALYADAPVSLSTTASSPSSDRNSSASTTSEKSGAKFELVVSAETSDEELAERLERMMSRMAPVLQRIDARTAYLDL